MRATAHPASDAPNQRKTRERVPPCPAQALSGRSLRPEKPQGAKRASESPARALDRHPRVGTPLAHARKRPARPPHHTPTRKPARNTTRRRQEERQRRRRFLDSPHVQDNQISIRRTFAPNRAPIPSPRSHGPTDAVGKFRTPEISAGPTFFGAIARACDQRRRSGPFFPPPPARPRARAWGAGSTAADELGDEETSRGTASTRRACQTASGHKCTGDFKQGGSRKRHGTTDRAREIAVAPARRAGARHRADD
jgi:hypothetical protein